MARAEGVLARGHWQGAPQQAPGPLRPWLGLREFFASKPGSLTYSQDGQRFDFQFQH
jgi:hypothetical protein